MSSSNLPHSYVCVLYFNIAKNYNALSDLLESSKDDLDILCIQEPPWKMIQCMPSAFNKEGTAVVGTPIHPMWNCMTCQPEPGSRPQVLTYVSKRLDHWRPAYRQDLVNNQDVMVISLFRKGDPIYLMNVYSDDQH
jgi:hypothetical protein